jgi:transcription factor Dp-1
MALCCLCLYYYMYHPLPIFIYSLFSLCSTPFELHDDNYVLKAMEFGDRPQSDTVTPNVTDGGEGSSMSGMHQSQVPLSSSSVSIRPPTSPPLPGILKARVKQEH